MLHAISVPQSPSSSIYVQESSLVSLTPIKVGSCGQPLPRYPGREYELYGSESDRRCRSRTESGDFRSFCGKSPLVGGADCSGGIDRGLFDQQNRQPVAHRIHPPARCAFQRLWIGLYFQVALAGWTNHQIEKVLGNHDGRIVRRSERFSPQSHRDTEEQNGSLVRLRSDGVFAERCDSIAPWFPGLPPCTSASPVVKVFRRFRMNMKAEVN